MTDRTLVSMWLYISLCSVYFSLALLISYSNGCSSPVRCYVPLLSICLSTLLGFFLLVAFHYLAIICQTIILSTGHWQSMWHSRLQSAIVCSSISSTSFCSKITSSQLNSLHNTNTCNSNAHYVPTRGSKSGVSFARGRLPSPKGYAICGAWGIRNVITKKVMRSKVT